MKKGGTVYRLLTSTVFQVLLIGLLGAAVYSNTLHVPFQLDDIPLIRNNPIIKDLDYIVHPGRAMEFKEYGQHLRRYLGNVTFALNYSIHGLDYPGYHIFNIVLHIANALLLYFFVSVTLRTPLVRGTSLEKRSGTVAFIISLIFVAHPVNTEAVTYIYQRVAVLSFTFYVSSLCLYGLARSGPFNRKRTVYYLLSVLCAVAAVKTKENALTLPLAVALYEIVFFTGSARKRAALLAPFLLPLLVYAGSLSHSGLSVKTVLLGQDKDVPGIVSRSSFDAGYLDPSSRRLEYLLTEPKVLATYLRLLVLPVNQNLLYDYPASVSFFEPSVLLSVMLHLILLALGAWLIVLSRRNGKAALGVAGFGIWFFYIALLMESGIVPLPLFIAEYRLYLPSVGFLMAAVSGIALGYERVGSDRKGALALAAVALIIIALCTATYSRNNVWRTRLSLWSDVVSKNPKLLMGYHGLGIAYTYSGEHEKAIRIFERLLKQDKNDIALFLQEIYYKLSSSYIQLGMYDKAVELLEKATSEKPDVVGYNYNLVFAYKQLGMWEESVSSYERILQELPDDYNSIMGLAEVYKVLRDPSRAMVLYERALAVRPGNFSANNNLASILLREDRPDEALPYIRAALKARPEDPNARMLLQFYNEKKK